MCNLYAAWGSGGSPSCRCRWRVGGQQQGALQRQEQRNSVRRGPASASLAAQLPEIPPGRGAPSSFVSHSSESTRSTPTALDEENSMCIALMCTSWVREGRNGPQHQ